MAEIPGSVARWALAGAGVIIFAAGTAWMSHINAQVDNLNEKDGEASAAQADVRERLGKVETKIEDLDRNVNELKADQKDATKELKDGQEKVLQKLDSVIRK